MGLYIIVQPPFSFFFCVVVSVVFAYILHFIPGVPKKRILKLFRKKMKEMFIKVNIL